MFIMGTCFPHRESTSWNFPPKSKFLFSLRISFIWYHKIQDWPSPLGGVTWSKYTECWPVRRKELIIIIRIKIKKYRVQGYVLPVEYLRNGKRYSSSVFTVAKAKSHATKWCKRRLCSCYHSRDIRPEATMNFECWPIRPSRFKKPSNDSSYGLITRNRLLVIFLLRIFEVIILTDLFWRPESHF